MASSPRTDAPGVVALDALADQLLVASGPLRVAPAATPAEVEAVQRLRYDHVVSAGWVEGSALPAGIESDAYDARAAQVAVWDEGSLVGTVRVVWPIPGARLPVEDDFDVDIEPHGRVVEVGRLLIAADRRGDPAHRAWGALFAQAWHEVRARDYLVLGGAVSKSLVGRFRALGLPFEILGPARHHWGAMRHPVRLDVSDARPRWFDGSG